VNTANKGAISKVYFLPWSRKNELYDFLKKSRVFSHVKARNFLALKMHFGEEGNHGYIKSEYIKPFVKIAREKTAFPFLTDTATIYVGKRSDAYHHALIAHKHGFTIENCDCPVIIADGLRGNAEISVDINQKHFKTAFIARDLYYADGFIFLNHFKGHEVTGFGGALKNMGMGSASKAGKYAMHHNSNPTANPDACNGCRQCLPWCATQALSLDKNKKIILNNKKCTGCGQCMVTCPKHVFNLAWNEGENAVQEKIVEYALAAVKNKPHASVNFLNHISKYCDCFSVKNPPLMDDVGITASVDPVALDQASYDLVNEAYGENFFKKLYPDLDSEVQLAYAEKLGLGNRKYELIKA